MHLKRIPSLAIAFTVILGGCASARVDQPDVYLYPPRAHQPSRIIADSPEAAANAARNALESIGYELQSTSPERKIVQSKIRQVPVPATCDCGAFNGIASSSFEIRMEQIQTGKTHVTAEHVCVATLPPPQSRSYRCASRGGPEYEFWGAFQKFLSVRR